MHKKPHLVHKYQGFPFYPSPIDALDFSSDADHFAACRKNGDIDIWSRDPFYNERTITSASRETRDMFFMLDQDNNDIIVTAGLDSYVRFYSLQTNKLLASIPSGGGSIWRMAKHNNLLAVACEDGSVRVIECTVSETGSYMNQAVIKYTLRGDQKRATTCAWYHDEKNQNLFIIGGSQSGKLYVWELPSEQERHMTLTASTVMNIQTGGKTCPWRIVSAPKYNEFLVGCSDGGVFVWDMIGRTQIQRIKLHKADVTAMAILPGNEGFFSAGLDNYVIKTVRQRNGIWVKGRKARNHTHDVWDIAISSDSNFMVSGGDDTGIVYYRLNEERDIRTFTLSPYPHIPRLSLVNIEANKKCCVLTKNEKSLELWSLAEIGDNVNDVRNPSEQLLVMKPKCGPIQAFAMSRAGDSIAVSDSERTKVYKIDWERKRANISLLTVNGEKPIFPPAERLLLAEHLLIVAGSDKKIYVYNFETNEQIHVFTEHTTSFNEMSGPISNIDISGDRKWLACADLTNRLNIFNLQTMELADTIEKFQERPISTIRFDPVTHKLVIALLNKQVRCYNTEELAFSPWTYTRRPIERKKEYSPDLKTSFGIMFNPGSPNVAYIYGKSTVLKLDLLTGNRANIRLGSKDVVFADYMRENTIVIIDRPWARILSHLPPPMVNPRFGNA